MAHASKTKKITVASSIAKTETVGHSRPHASTSNTHALSQAQPKVSIHPPHFLKLTEKIKLGRHYPTQPNCQ
jgi:hypothetical protein